MRGRYRVQFDTVVRVDGFCNAHPFTTAGEIAAANRLGALVLKVRALADQHQDGRLTVRTATKEGKEIREAMYVPLRQLVTLAVDAAVKLPALGRRFVMPSQHQARQSYITNVRRMLTDARAHQDALLTEGMAPTLLDELTGLLDRYQELFTIASDGKRLHTGAAGDLKVVMAEVMDVIDKLDVINTHRFQGNAELLTAWKSARNVAWPKKDAAAAKKKKARQQKGDEAAAS